MGKKTVFVAGYANLPKDIPAYTLYKTVGIYLAVDPERGAILDVDASLYSRLAKELLKEIFMGANLFEDRESILEELEQRYWGSARKAMLAAARKAFSNFDEIRAELAEKAEQGTSAAPEEVE